MADAGDLGKLPPEIRKEIYAYLLAESHITPINSPRKAKSKHDTVTLWSKTKQSSAILRVNKLISKEAVQVMYGCNKFEFVNAGVLQDFLRQIGDAKRHLRHIAICQDGLVFMGSWTSTKNSVQMLASVEGLRTLEIPHSALCRTSTLKNKIQIKQLVEHCKPLLAALNGHFIKEGLGASAFNIIQIPVPVGVCKLRGTCRAKVEHPRIVFVTDYITRSHTKKLSPLQCHCACSKLEDENNKIKQELKEEIAKQLNLELP